MDAIQQIEAQEAIEMQYNRKFIDGYIRESIEKNPVMQAKIVQGIALVQGYMSQTYTYTTKDGVVHDFATKNNRIEQLKQMDVPALVVSIFVGIAYCLQEELFTSVTAMLASRLKFSDKVEAIKTVAELVAVLCGTDAFDINKPSKQGSLVIKSLIPLEPSLIRFIENSKYLPPMVCLPLPLENNYSSGYLTHNDSLLLGAGNHHDGDICLDVLNLVNRVQLKLDTDFLSTVEEVPTFEVETEAQKLQWMEFKRQSYEFYVLIAKNGNKFWLTHKCDKRGRIYASGFHISTMGTAFKKACVELANEELVTGVLC